ncbi:TetR/AcrR family transcriptional regulator [Bradyrhizobium sp. 83002]|uniref:TetR/AcrR family transcriptional regulator n=1 Tax=Bradyrhizobium aeschynomenes TaxID=2734909 RepID=UPI001555D154|nr:TetR/AcrR family transcriptional regulator [Bradyrhizobium aeschynomenes]NPU09702.1 TetR/AcrR family transcriptional regulator [Bradyrhizobium aeschynomenes]
MARPRSEEKRNAILAATIDLVAEQGLGAATADVAKRARVPHGSVFTYFGTKAELLNAVYVELKSELADAIMKRMPDDGSVRDQLRHLWMSWTAWGVSSPSKRRTLAQLSVSNQITEDSRRAAMTVAGGAVEIVQRAASNGALRAMPISYVGALVETMVGTTMDFMMRDHENAEAIRDAGFEALWQALN